MSADACTGPAGPWHVEPAAAEVSPKQLSDLLTFPASWGPSEWGPIPYLPSEDVLVKRMEKQWGALASYR
jgi:magnesium chelatase subunit H